MRQFLRVGAYFRADLPWLMVSLVLLGFQLGAGLLKPWPLALAVDHVLSDRPAPEWLATWQGQHSRETILVLLCGTLLLLHGFQGGIGALQNILVIKIGLRGLARVRTEVFQRLQFTSLRFFQNTRQGDVIYRASWDTYAFQTLFQQGFMGLLSGALSLALMSIVMARLSPGLTVVALLTVPMLGLVMRFFGRQMAQTSREAHQADSRVTAFIQQAIEALPLIRSYTQEERQTNRFAGHADEALNRRLTQHRWEVGYLGLIGIVFGLGSAGILWVGGRLVWRGDLSLGELLVFLAYLSQFFDPLNQLSRVGATASEAITGVRRVFELLDAPLETQELAQGSIDRCADVRGPKAPVVLPAPQKGIQGRLKLDRVSFAYEQDRPVLREVSFVLEPKQCLAIVGQSGAGKSTLLALLARFFDPDAGRILIDGVDLNDYPLREWRTRVTHVMQEPIIIPATVQENLALGFPQADLDQIQKAAKAAHADAFIRSLPQEYETPIGDGALRLSAGEKQRISLARAFLKNAPILLLDEPTSTLDVESEQLVLESLQRLVQGRTTMIVTHRPTNILLAQAVLVMESGRVTAAGSPEEVLGKSPFLGRLIQGQRGYGS
ncbi:MAG TPA: ABC transporter ATP-binding protein [Candidatus Paceibacterota bacterium]|nr:ABC transporter ATP-binding protein [Verrucomicrobiota bacterium]HRY50035.1 ABC transporter ATP-binding protein [Candidatus Paceibacterota bacterium]